MDNFQGILFGLLLIFIIWRIIEGPKCGGSAGPCYSELFNNYCKCKKCNYACYINDKNYRKCSWY